MILFKKINKMNFTNININFNKLRGIFTKSQKEVLNTGDGKRNLYFDYQRTIFLRFQLDVATTCESIFKIHKNEIIQNIQKLYGNNINLDNFGFLIVEINANKFDGTPNLINVKLRNDDNIIFRVLLNSQLMLGFLVITKHNIILKKNVRNYGLLNPINFQNNDNEEKQEKKKKSGDIHIYYQKNPIHYCQGYTFVKEKMIITENEIIIYSKQNYKLLIKDIRTTSMFLSTNEEDAKKYLKDYKIYGERPTFCIEIKTQNDQRLLIGKNSYDSFMILYRALDAAINNYQNHYSHFNINNKIKIHNMNLFSLSNETLKNTSSLDEFIVNKNKTKILLKNFKEIELANIINNIIEYKYNLKKGKYVFALINIKILIDIINHLENENKFLDLIKTEYIKNIKDSWEIINDLNFVKNIFANNNSKINEDNQKVIKDSVKENNSEINCNDNITKDIIFIDKNNINKTIEMSEENIIELKKKLNINIFDNLFLEIKQNYISQYYEENKGETQELKSNIKLILGNYFCQNFEMKKEQDFLYLGGEEIEKTINDFKEELILEREGIISAI